MDLTVKLPGNDFKLIREYTSKTDYYATTPQGMYYWNGDSTDVIPGFMGVNWTANVFSMILGDTGSTPDRLTLVGLPLRTVRKFEYVNTTGSYHGLNANNQYIVSATTNIAGMSGSIPVWRVIEPGGVERDYVRNDGMSSPTGWDKGDIIGRLVRERDSFGNEHYYEWFSLHTPIGGIGRTPRLKAIHLNAEVDSSGMVTSSLAEMRFLWWGQEGADGYEFDYPNLPNTTNQWYYGRVAEVQVIRDDGSQEGLVTQRVEYTYFDEWVGLKEFGQGTSDDSLDEVYDAIHGDLCEVVQSVRVNNDVGAAGSDDDFYDRVTQYRYYGNSLGSGLYESSLNNNFELEFAGADHQLLAVIYPDQIEYFADHYNQLAAGSGTAYGAVASVAEAARRLRWIRFDEGVDQTTGYYFHNPASIFLPGTYWNSLHQIVSKIIDYYPSSDVKNRVRTQIVNAGGSSGCGCSGPDGSGLGKRYDYLYSRYNWTFSIGGLPSWLSDRLDLTGADGYSCQVVESHAAVVSGGLKYVPYRVYSHDYYWPSNYNAGNVNGASDVPEVGLAIRKMMSVVSEANLDWELGSTTEEPFLENGKHWVTRNYYAYTVDPLTARFTNYGKLTRRVTPSAMDYTTYVPALGASSPVAPDLYSGEGLVYDYSYTDGYLTSVDVKKGVGGTGETVSEFDYLTLGAYRPDLRTSVTRNAGGDVVETTEYAYDYYNLGFDTEVLSLMRVTQTRETAAQNGPTNGEDAETYTLFNRFGQSVWTLDPDDVLEYRQYDDVTGALVLRVRDADPSGSYVQSGDAINTTNFPGSFTAPSPPSAGYQELTDAYEVDLLGRVIKHTDPGGVESFYRYELLATDVPDESTGSLVDRGVPMYAEIRLPHELTGGGFDGPISISWMDAASRVLRSSGFIASDGGGTYDPLDDQYSLGDEVQRSDTVRSINGLTLRSIAWHNIDTLNALSGAIETTYEYDSMGRISKVTDPEGGVTQYGSGTEIGYDILDRPISVLSGTTSGVSLISKTYYDSAETSGFPTATQGVGNGVVRRTESYDGEGGTRVTNMWYDYRDRMVARENPEAPHQVYAYDNLDRVIEQASFTDGVYRTGTELYEPSVFDDNRSTYRQILYNNRGMVYNSRVAIDPTEDQDDQENFTGYLETNSWFDIDGNLIASWSPNSASTKYEYDALDRPTVIYQTDRGGDAGPGDGSFASASTITGDHVISQMEYSYISNGDAGAGQVELITSRMRHHDDATSVGALTTSNSVATYTGYVYDDASRQTHALSYGTNDSSGFVSSTTAPSTPFETDRSLTSALISSVAFDDWGRTSVLTDPADKDTLTLYDDLSRTIATIESQTAIDANQVGTNTAGDNWEVTWTGTPPADQDRVTTFWYDGNSNVVRRTAHINGGDVQVTEYVYGTSVGSSSNTMDSLVSSSNLLSAVHYPNESTGAADSSSAYTVNYAYNRLGELRGTTDQNGTVHKLTRDNVGRIISDEAETLGSGIDNAVREITASFDDHGRIKTIESENVSNTVVNGVQFEYTPLHQISRIYQEHDGAVVTGGTPSESVEYFYDDAAPSGISGNYSRISGIKYPSQVAQGSGSDNTLSIYYGSGIDDLISRVTNYTAPSWNPTTPPELVSYEYIGRGIAAKVNYPDITTSLTAVQGYDGSSATGAYPGFDQYGRRIWHAWVRHDATNPANTINFGTGSNTGQPNQTPLVARRYAYDDMSNRIYDWDGRPGAVPDDRDWEYQYDGLDRLKTAFRGLRDDEKSPASIGTIADFSRQWTLDMLGNWNNVITDADQDGLFETTDDQEDRTFNAANEALTRELPSGNDFGTIADPMQYDHAGNFLSNRAVGSYDLEYTHDAWNRLVEVEKVLSGGARTTILKNTFNGLNWRVSREVDLAKGAYDGIDEQRDYFYSAGWQMIEERVDADNDDDFELESTDDYLSQQVWGARYIDDAVAKRIVEDSSVSRTYYYLTDAMFSVRALTNSSGRVVERIDYSPYGVASHSYAGDINNDGVINYFDTTPATSNAGGSTVLVPGDTGYDPDVDSNGDGMDFFDVSAFLSQNSAFNGVTNPDGWLTDPTDLDWTDNSIGYDGYFFDYAGATDATASGLYCVRFRTYDPGMGRWLQRDPVRYRGGNTLYEYGHSNPIIYPDPMGLDPLKQFIRDKFGWIENLFDKKPSPTSGDDCTEWSTYEYRDPELIKEELVRTDGITLPATDLLDLVLTIGEELGVGDTEVQSYQDLDSGQGVNKNQLANNVAMGIDSGTAYYACRCTWQVTELQSRECCISGGGTQTQKRGKLGVTYFTHGVLVAHRHWLTGRWILRCHCPKPGQESKWKRPQTAEERRGAPAKITNG